MCLKADAKSFLNAESITVTMVLAKLAICDVGTRYICAKERD